MFDTIFSAATAYLSTNLDYLILLMAFFAQTTSPRKFRLILYGDILGSLVLVGGSLTLGIILHIIPQEWLLGLLGLIPLSFGIKLLCQAPAPETFNPQQQRGLALSRSVALITVTSCSADNIGIYTPLFASMQTASEIYLTLITFAVMLFLIFGLALLIYHLPLMATTIENYGRWLSAIIYLGLGSYILIESGTISHLISLL